MNVTVTSGSMSLVRSTDGRALVSGESIRTSEFILTEKKAKISKRCVIKCPSNILLATAIISHNTILRADLATLKIEMYSIIADGTVIHPPLTRRGEYTSVSIGKYTIIGPNCVIKASTIGNCVRIGQRCVLDENCVIGNNAVIEDDSVVSAETEIPPNTIFGGNPARYKGRCLPNSYSKCIIESINIYEGLVLGNED